MPDNSKTLAAVMALAFGLTTMGATQPNLLWVQRFGDSTTLHAAADAVVSSQGNVTTLGLSESELGGFAPWIWRVRADGTTFVQSFGPGTVALGGAPMVLGLRGPSGFWAAYPSPNVDVDVRIVHFSRSGGIASQTSYDDAQAGQLHNEDIPATLVTLPDGSAVLAGTSTRSAETTKPFVARLAPDASVQWVFRDLDVTDTDGSAVRLIVDSSRAYLLASASTPLSGIDPVVTALDLSSGKVIWRTRLPAISGALTDDFPVVIQANSGSIYVMATGIDPGRVAPPVASSHDLRLWKLMADTGSIAWGHNYAYAINESQTSFRNVRPVALGFDSLGRVIVAGTVPNSGLHDQLFLRVLNGNGNLAWHRFYEGDLPSLKPASIAADADGSIYVAGSWTTSGTGHPASALAAVRKFDRIQGDPLWLAALPPNPEFGGSFSSLVVHGTDELTALGSETSRFGGGNAVVARFGQARTVAGLVSLSQFTGNTANVALSLGVYEEGELTSSTPLLLNQGDFAVAMPVLAGPATVRVSASGRFLSSSVECSFGPEGVSGLTFALLNGDVNSDNTVNIQDFLSRRSAFGSSPGTAGWNELADLNGDDSVSVQDFLILRQNFGRTGS